MKILICLLLLAPVFLSAQQDSVSFWLDLQHDESGALYQLNDSVPLHIRREFRLSATLPAEYAVELWEDSLCLLQERRAGRWATVDTLLYQTWFTDYCPAFQVTDFNCDGYFDLNAVLSTNINGNLWGKIFLYNAQTGALQEVPSVTDPTDYSEGGWWGAPEYDCHMHTITSTQVCGIYGIAYTATYRLEGLTAVPLKKTVHDTTRLDMWGKGGFTFYFTGKNGQWALKRKRKIRQ